MRSSAIGRLITRLSGIIGRVPGGAIMRLCGALKRVVSGSAVLGWTDHAAARNFPQKDEYLLRFPKRLAAGPLFESAAQWAAAMVPALILLTDERERAAAVIIVLIGAARTAGGDVKVVALEDAAAHADADALERKVFNRVYGRWLALLLLGSAFSVVFGSVNVQSAIWYEWIFWWIAAWMAYKSGRLIIRAWHFGAVLAGLGLVFGILAVLQKITGYGDVAGWIPLTIRPTISARPTGFFGNPNVFAAAANLVMWPLAALLIDSAGRRMTGQKRVVQNIFYAVGLAGLMLALLLTRSRAALLGAIGAVAIMAPQIPVFHKLKVRPGFWVAVGASLLLISMLLAPIGAEHSFGVRRSSLEPIQNQQTAWQGRLTIWKETISLFLRSPLSGGGPGSLSNIALPGGGQALHAHNMLLQWLAETGLILTLIMLLFICWYFVQAFKRIQTWRSNINSSSAPHPNAHTRSLMLPGFTAAITAVLIHGIFDYPWAARSIGLLWWVWIGFGLSLATAK